MTQSLADPSPFPEQRYTEFVDLCRWDSLQRFPQLRSLWFALACISWPTLVCAGWFAMTQYEMTAGESAQAPKTWPVNAGLSRPKDLPALLLFAHPQCPCTRASVEQLSRIVAASSRRVHPYAIFLQPAGFSEVWTHSSTWNRAAAIPGVTVLPDRSGQIAAAFGAKTSGQSLLFDLKGNLVFTGGITASRGHDGDNMGSQAVLLFLISGKLMNVHTPVFGCSLVTLPEQSPERRL